MTINIIYQLKKRLDFNNVQSVLVAFCSTRLLILIVLYLSMVQIPVLSGDLLWRYNANNIIPDGLIRWDSGWYIPIALSGYSRIQQTAFFPLYPLFIRALSSITGNVYTSGLYISNISFFLALLYLYAIVKKELSHKIAARTVFYLSATPAAFFFSTVYSESLCLLFFLACIYYSINHKWFLASVAGALASATRLTGVMAGVFIFFEVIIQSGVKISLFNNGKNFSSIVINIKDFFLKTWQGFFACIFSFSGIILYSVYLGKTFMNPLAFISAEADWGKTVDINWPVKLLNNFFEMVRITGNFFSGDIADIDGLIDFSAILFFIPLVFWVFKKFRLSYSISNLFCFLIPLVSSNPDSMRRYVLMLFPCFILLAKIGKNEWVDRIITVSFLMLQSYFLVLFSHWFFAG